MKKVLYWLTARPLFDLLGKIYRWLMGRLERIPEFLRYREFGARVTDRLYRIVRLPRGVEETIDPFLEIEKGRKMDPAIAFTVLAFMAALGVYPSALGHLDTAPGIWKALPIVSGFNPYLGLVSGVVFSAADWLGKVFPVFEDVYAANAGDGVQNWVGARIGYLLAYTTIFLTGVLPGVLSRVFRWVLGDLFRRFIPKKAAQAVVALVLVAGAGAVLAHGGADLMPLGLGMLPMVVLMAGPGLGDSRPDPTRQEALGAGQPTGGASGAGGAPPGDASADADLWAGALATMSAMVGATVGIVAAEEWAKHVGNYGAFYALRADPDVGCRALSEGNYGRLQQHAPTTGVGAGIMPPGAAGAMVQGGVQAPGPPPAPNPLNQQLGEGKDGDSVSAWKQTDDGKLVGAGFVWDPRTGGWREVGHGERDGKGNVWDAQHGAWFDAAGAADAARARQEDAAWWEEVRRKTAAREFESQKKLDALTAEITAMEQAKRAREAAEAAQRQREEEYRADLLRKYGSRQAMDEWQAKREAHQATHGGMKDFASDFLDGSLQDAKTMAHDMIRDVGRAARSVAHAATIGVYDAMTNPENRQIAWDTTVGTLRDLLPHNLPGSIYDATGRIYEGGAKAAGHLADFVAKEGLVGAAKTILGVDNWEKAFDPNVPPAERGWRSLFGAVDATLNFGAAGLAKGAALADKINDARALTNIWETGGDVTRAVDKMRDSAQVAARAGEKSKDLGKALDRLEKAQDAAELAAKERKAFAAAQEQAAQKLEKLQDAVKSGDHDAIRRAAIEVQQDKSALYKLNREKAAFQKEIEALDDHLMKPREPGVPPSSADSVAQRVDDDVIDALRREDIAAGRPPREYQAVLTTNPKKGLKSAAHDLDRTYRVKDANGRWVDVPRDKVKPIYEGSLYRHADGASVSSSPEAFRKKMDFEITDGRFSESYGFKAQDPGVEAAWKGADDVDRLIGRKQVGVRPDGTPIYQEVSRAGENLRDARGASATISHKAEHWYQHADDLREAAKKEFADAKGYAEADQALKEAAEARGNDLLAQAAEAEVEGMRQTAKQFGNQVKPRWTAARDALAKQLPPGSSIDDVMPAWKIDRLEEATSIMEAGRAQGWSPSQINEVLTKRLGVDSTRVSHDVGEMVEALQTLKPSGPVAPQDWGLLRVPAGVVDRTLDVASGGEGEGLVFGRIVGGGS